MTRITIEYSEDFRENRKVSEVFGILRDKGFNPIDLFLRYYAGRGTGKCVYIFQEETELPSQEELKEMLKGVGLTEIAKEYF